MRVKVVSLMALVLLAVSAYADYITNYTLYAMWSRTYTFDKFGFVGIAVDVGPIRLGEWEVRTVEEVILDGLPPDTLIRDRSRYRSTTIYGIDPGMRASAWLPNGTPIEYTFTRATAMFEPVEDIDVRRDVKWYVFSNLHRNDIWWLKPVGVRYGLRITVKSDDRPVLDFSCLKYVKTVITRGARREVYNATCPGNTSTVYYVDVYFMYAWTGEKKLCIFAQLFNAAEYVAGKGGRAMLLDYCRPAERFPRNITAVVMPWSGRQSRLDIYVDGIRFDTLWIGGPNAKLYTGPYQFPTSLWLTITTAYVDLNYPGVVQKPLGSALLLIGNDTVMAPPRYVLKEKDTAWTQARVELTHDQGVAVLPSRTYDNSTVYAWPVVPVKIHGRPTELPYRALVNAAKLCPGGAVVSGRYSWVGGWVEVRGPTSIHCAEYPVEFHLTNGTSLSMQAPFNKTFVWTPPAVAYPNSTRLEADPVAVFVDGPKAVRVNYTRVYYLVRVATPLGVNETWAPRGAAAGTPAVISLGNGTRWVAEGLASAVAEGPLVLAPRYKRQYLVRLEAPVNSTETWVDEGLTFAVGLPDPWHLPNGTRFARLLINSTAARELRVDKPMTLRAQYAEVYYWAVVETPVNKTAGWMPKGTMLKFPDVVDFGYGTRLIKPSVREVAVEGPVVLKVEYAKRQHYVKIEGVNRWEGWADAGAVVRLNSTVVGGVEYTPAEVVTAISPGVYRPLFYAVYRTVARDVLGLPNPLGTVKLCNATAQAGLDSSAVVATYTRELCQPTVEASPISPYTAAGAAAVATAVVLTLRRRKK
jgi:hypothetical protein